MSRTRLVRGEIASVLLLTVAATVVYALRDGTYDVVARGEAGIIAWWALALGVASGVLPRSRPGRATWTMAAGLCALALWTTLAFAWTESDERTSLELSQTLHHLGLFALAAALLTRRTVGAALAGALIGGAVVTVLAVASRLFPDAFPANAVLVALDVDRLSYPFGYWNATAAWSVMTATVALAVSVHAPRSAWRAAALAVIPFAVVAVYLAYSRQGVVGFALGAAVVLACSRTRAVAALHLLAATVAGGFAVLVVRGSDEIADATGTDGRLGVLAALAVGGAGCAAVATVVHRAGGDERLLIDPRRARPLAYAVAVIVALGAIAVGPAVAERAADSFDTGGISGAAPEDSSQRLLNLSGNRDLQWSTALDAFASDPLKGIGPGTYEFFWNRAAVDGEAVRNAHSLFLETLAELGVPGLLALLIALGGAVYGGVSWRRGAQDRAQAGAATAALAGVVVWIWHASIDWMWEQTAVTALALLLAAIAGAAGSAPRRPLRPVVRGGIALLCLLAALAQLPPVVGTSRVRDSQRAAGAGDLAAARAAAEDAVASWPWAAAPFVQRALVNELAGEPAVAEVDARRAAEREPTNWRHQILLARVLAEQGRTAEALDAYRSARALRPVSIVFNAP